MNEKSLSRRLRLWGYHRLYDELAWAYDTVSYLVSQGEWSQWRRLALDYAEGERILEIGYGTGELLIEAARRGLPVMGLERSAAMQRITGRKLERLSLTVPRLRGDIGALPFTSGSIDTILATFPAEYILTPVIWRELGRVLRAPDLQSGGTGGRVVAVGIVVYLEQPAVRSAARLLPGGKPNTSLEECRLLAEEVGLSTRVEIRQQRRSRVPILIAERTAK